MKNIAVRGISEDKYLRFFAVDCTEAAVEAARLHNLSIANTVTMGRAIAATLLIGLELKNKQDVVTLKIESNGISGGVLVTGKADGSVKGYVRNPQAEFSLDEKIDSKKALGEESLTIIKDIGMKQPYVGTVELFYGEIAKDLTYYYAKSEQIPTSIGLGVLLDENGKVKQAGGFMIQLLPETPDEKIEAIEKLIAHFPNLTDLMDMGYSLQTILEKILLQEIQLRFLEEKKVSYYCDCSREKFSKGLKLLDKEELQKAMESNETIKTICHFCNTTYDFSKENIAKILHEL